MIYIIFLTPIMYDLIFDVFDAIRYESKNDWSVALKNLEETLSPFKLSPDLRIYNIKINYVPIFCFLFYFSA